MRSDIRSSCSTATAHARSKPSAIRIGWMPRSSKASLCSRRAPARTTKKLLKQNQILCEKERTDDACSAITNFIVLAF